MYYCPNTVMLLFRAATLNRMR